MPFSLLKAPDIDSETDNESDRCILKPSNVSKAMESWFLLPFQTQLTKMITTKLDVRKFSEEKIMSNSVFVQFYTYISDLFQIHTLFS